MFQILPDGERFSEYVLLRDGETVLLRTATAADVPAVAAFMEGVSRESLHSRFMGAVAHVSRATIEATCAAEPRKRLCLLAIVGQEPDSQVVAAGNYISMRLGGSAEVAFLVRDDFQGRGISTLLLERLAGIAAASGFTGFEAEVFADNRAMLGVFRDFGFEIHQAALGGGCVHVHFPVDGLAAVREHAELRDRIATANSLVPLLRPRTVAVVGASRDPAAAGSMIFSAMLRGNFRGTAYPVNRRASSVQGVRAYASVHDLPEPAELVAIAVPADAVLEVATDALHAGAKGLLVITSGFAESGGEGTARQAALVEMVRSHGARLIGPNCLGLMNTHPDVSLNASLAPAMAPRGRLGFYSHSAALGLVILEYAAERGLGFSSFVSAGNRADVSGNDLLRFWEEDADTDVALLYLETFGNPRRFARIARRLSGRKPIVCVKSARSQAGRDVARAHIGATAQSEASVETLFRQAGVIRADTLEQMFDAAALLANQPLPGGGRTAIISNSGGVLTICADACEARGLVVGAPQMVDLGMLAPVRAYEIAVQRAIEHSEVDALIVIFACVGGCDPRVVGRAIRRGVLRGERRSGAAKPVLLCLMGAAGALRFGSGRNRRGVAAGRVFPSYRFPESAAMALSLAVQYAAFRRQPAGRLAWYEDVDADAARREVAAVLDAAAGDGDETVWLEGERARSILRCFGIRAAADAVNRSAAPIDALGTTIEVRSDPSFGPLLHVLRDGRPPLTRITPLTDRDVRAVVEAAGLPADRGIEELLGRVSQMLEELPWLCGMTAEIRCAHQDPGAAGAVLGAGTRLGLCTARSGARS
ncbi:MAG TPA: GNAT family N-acetyltransferase [Thermoanaerobaculia bacterium]|nr:GNAT family N-acetyltransferase [Thermoanaerobaculia bacterium]